MLSNGLVLFFRLMHIVSAVFWVGGVTLLARFVFPAARALGPAAGPMMNQLTQVQKLPRALLGAGVMTVLSGLVLFWHDSLGFHGPWMRSVTGMVFGTGGLLAILGLLIGATVNNPTAKKLGALGAVILAQGAPPSAEQSAEMKRLQSRLGSALIGVLTLLVLATAAMALARYL